MKNYQILQESIDKAMRSGAYSLQESDIIIQSLKVLAKDLQELESLRAEQDARNQTGPEAPQKSKK